MPARHLSSVLLPLPLRPTIPKNSPALTSKLTSFSASSSSYVLDAKGCRARSLSVVYCWCGRRKLLLTARTATALGALARRLARRSAVSGAVALTGVRKLAVAALGIAHETFSSTRSRQAAGGPGRARGGASAGRA